MRLVYGQRERYALSTVLSVERHAPNFSPAAGRCGDDVRTISNDASEIIVLTAFDCMSSKIRRSASILIKQ